MNELALANFNSAMSCAPVVALREEALRKFRVAIRMWSLPEQITPEEEKLLRTAHRMVVRLYCAAQAAGGRPRASSE